MKKHENILSLLDIINNKFGKNVFHVVDYWNIFDAIGLQRNNKLIYIEIIKPKYYFYECEFLLDDPDRPYIAGDSDNATTQQLLDVMSNFFGIERKDKQYPGK